MYTSIWLLEMEFCFVNKLSCLCMWSVLHSLIKSVLPSLCSLYVLFCLCSVYFLLFCLLYLTLTCGFSSFSVLRIKIPSRLRPCERRTLAVGTGHVLWAWYVDTNEPRPQGPFPRERWRHRRSPCWFQLTEGEREGGREEEGPSAISLTPKPNIIIVFL